MNRYATSYVGLGLSACGIALLSVSWPAAVAVTFVAQMAALVGSGRISVARTRAIAVFCVLLHAAAIAQGTGRITLGLAVIPLPLLALPWEPVVRRFGYKGGELAPLVGLLFVGLVLASWPPASSWWAVAPSFAVLLLFTAMSFVSVRDFRLSRRKSWGVAVGDAVPDFRLPARAGKGEFALSEQRGSYVFVQFTRGDWCPHCHVVMRIFHRESKRLADNGVKVVVITTDGGAQADDLANKLDLGYSVLVDAKNEVAAKLGALQTNAIRGRHYPLPASFLIGPDGKLVYASRPDDVATFLEPAEAIRIVQARGGPA